MIKKFTFVVAGLLLTSQPIFAQEPVEIIGRICKSTEAVLVFDNFNGNLNLKDAVDVNGDFEAELSHGEYVEKIAQINGHKTVPLDLMGDASLPNIEAGLSAVLSDLETGKAKYSHINLSQETPIRLGAFKMDLFPNDDSFPEMDAQNIAIYKNRILEKIWTDVPDFRLKELFTTLTRLEKLGVPVVVAAGNFGPAYVNLFSLLPGVISVGSLELDGTKRLLSADNALVTVWRTGSYVSQQVVGGVDINSDGIIDFTEDRLSKEQKIVDMFVGKQASTTAISVKPDFMEWLVKLGSVPDPVANTALKVIPPGLYRVDELASLPTVTKGTSAHFKKSGVYAYKIPIVPPTFFFGDDGNGNIIFDPLRTGEKNQLVMVSGTSFAAPSLCRGQK